MKTLALALASSVLLAVAAPEDVLELGGVRHRLTVSGTQYLALVAWLSWMSRRLHRD